MITSGGRPNIRTLGLICSVALLTIANTPVRAQTAEEQERSFRREAMEQALQTKQQFDLYGLHFDSNKATIQPESKQLLDEIATALKNFPDWRLRIVGHTDASGNPEHNLHLSLERALAIEAALVERGIDSQRLIPAGLGESRPVTSNATPEGRALNRRVELDRVTDSAEAKQRLKAMSDFLAAQKSLSVAFDTVFEVVTPTDQKLGLASSGTVTLVRPDKIRVARSGGFADFEILYDGKALTLLGKNANLYTQVAAPGTVDQLIDDLRDKYKRPLPGADLLLTNS
jgi:outer membrane protein OmpA-like peptidoglycan-associated protein